MGILFEKLTKFFVFIYPYLGWGYIIQATRANSENVDHIKDSKTNSL